MKWWEVIIQLIQATVPALIVYLTVTNLAKEFFRKEYNVRLLDNQKDAKHITLPLKLQAYERLALFCERIKIHNLVMRLQAETPNARFLQSAILITIQQEYEHNIAQQVYVSKELWQILQFAKNQTISIISAVYKSLPENAATQDFTQALFKYLDDAEADPLDTALAAIKKEIELSL